MTRGIDIGRERQKQSERGFSLIELVMATAVFGVAFVLVAGSLGSVTVTNKMSEKKQAALSQISTLLEDVQESSFNEIMAYTAPTLHGLGDDATVTAQCINSVGSALTLPITDAAVQAALPNPFEVRVMITWKEGPGQYISKRSSVMVRR
jgi:prepilin-type N-terminal cleavage/methylation domain-containing protein